MVNVQAFPLYWPLGWRRTRVRRSSNFDKSKLTIGKARDMLLAEVSRMNGSSVVISSNLEIRRDGLPYSNQANPDDPGVAVYFARKGKQMCFGCDCYSTVRENLYAIAKTIDALRGIERWGASDMMERAFTGFASLPAKASQSWREVLGLVATRELSRETIESAYRALAKMHHPDAGGDREMFERVTKARADALAELAA